MLFICLALRLFRQVSDLLGRHDTHGVPCLAQEQRTHLSFTPLQLQHRTAIIIIILILLIIILPFLLLLLIFVDHVSSSEQPRGALKF